MLGADDLGDVADGDDVDDVDEVADLDFRLVAMLEVFFG